MWQEISKLFNLITMMMPYRYWKALRQSENGRECISAAQMPEDFIILVYEIVDNSVDEALAGYGDHITVKIHKDHSISVSDQGRGMPTGMHKIGKPTPEVILTIFMQGENLAKEVIKQAAVCTVLEPLLSMPYRSGWLLQLNGMALFMNRRFENGGKPVTTLEKTGKTNQTGTKIHFKPDTTIFSNITFNYDIIM